jgi:Ser/Thr protein kinase RdoA (MazF antagonist)
MAALTALDRFPVEPEAVELVAHSENVTYRVAVRGTETDYSLRLHRPGYNTIEQLESERAWTRALSAAGIDVPKSLASRGGEHFVLIDIPGANEQRYAGMRTWFKGQTLRDYLDSPSGGRIGELAAALHNQATSWQEPPGFTLQRLDLDGLLGKAPFWGRFWEHKHLTATEERLLRKVRARLRDTLADYGARRDNFSVIHADLHPDNIVYDGDDLALIDFDDAACGWHMYDIASALIDDSAAPDHPAISTALLDGYQKHRPLADRDIDMLHTFLLIRGMAIIGWFHQRPEHTETAYFDEIKQWVIAECESNEW